MPEDHFVNMIRSLRKNEEILLYTCSFAVHDTAAVTDMLRVEYHKEVWSYPYQAPAFEAGAAIWAAQTLYIASQLILFRQNKEADIKNLLPAYTGPVNASAILSADLCLRFLPFLIVQLRAIDGEDVLIELLEQLLARWHYSGISYALPVADLDLTAITENDCLCQLYADRVIEQRNIKLALHPACRPLIKASLGYLGKIYWKEFTIETDNNE